MQKAFKVTKFKVRYKFTQQVIEDLGPKHVGSFVKVGNKYRFNKNVHFSIGPEKRHSGALAVLTFGKGKDNIGHVTVHKLTQRTTGDIHMHAFSKWGIDKRALVALMRKSAKRQGYDLDP